MKLKYILLAIFFYLISLLITLPAAVVSYFIPENSGLKVAVASGTLWQGKAQQLVINNKYHLKQVKWDVDWLALLGLQFKVDLQFTNGRDGVSGKGDVMVGFSGLSVEQLLIDISAPELLSYINLPVPIDAQGNISLVIKEASQGVPYCEQIEGSLIWDNAYIESTMGNIALQRVDVDLSCDNGQVSADIKQQSAQLDSQISVLLSEGGAYQLSGLIKDSDKLAPTIKQALPWIGSKNSNGATVLNFKGKL